MGFNRIYTVDNIKQDSVYMSGRVVFLQSNCVLFCAPNISKHPNPLVFAGQEALCKAIIAFQAIYPESNRGNTQLSCWSTLGTWLVRFHLQDWWGTSLNHMMQTNLHTEGHIFIRGPSTSSTWVMAGMFGISTLYIRVMVLFCLF